MMIRKATRADLQQIVEVHLAAFEGFFLSMLGKPFLRKMYQAFSSEQHGVIRVAIDDEQRVVGFAAGTLAPDLYFPALRKKKWFAFLITAIPGIIKHPIKVLRKLYYAMFYRGDKPETLQQTALLSSIAVLPAMAGKSVGKALLADFEQQVMQAGGNCLYLTTDKHGNAAVVAFYTKAGYQIESEFTQPDGRQMLRLTKSF
ncbi:GNAT family N-acetyltransferase [Marinomonas communis]|uniref:Acetyltransferase (GNAT) family protein n=1 Tax=Marinomonas communis TaxID=28254 RepID=A0A4R6X6Y7_9GAMM|nr:GNAT family N-acetyltransferase [Marinomonas communis]TDR13084.1 acetyltransferase (GNAT) family protein [Marinomonas communis]